MSNWADLLEVILVGLIAGVGLSVAFAWAIRGVMSAGSARRDGEMAAFLGHALVALLGVAVCVGAIGFALYSMIHH